MGDAPPAALAPPVNARTAPYWEALARRRRLEIERCQDCGHFVHYPRSRCPMCWSRDLAWEPVSGRGRLVSWSTTHRATAPQLEGLVPLTSGLVELDEQRALHVVAWLIDAGNADLHVGTRVEADVVDTSEHPLLVFRPA